MPGTIPFEAGGQTIALSEDEDIVARLLSGLDSRTYNERPPFPRNYTPANLTPSPSEHAWLDRIDMKRTGVRFFWTRNEAGKIEDFVEIILPGLIRYTNSIRPASPEVIAKWPEEYAAYMRFKRTETSAFYRLLFKFRQKFRRFAHADKVRQENA